MKLKEIVNQRYLIKSEKSRGNQGIVYEVYDLVLNKYWIMKTVVSEEEESKQREVCREMEILSQLSEEGIPRIIDCFIQDHQTCIVMEYLSGMTLTEWMNMYPEKCKEKTIPFALEIARLVGKLHAFTPPIVFADLKPDNILVDENEHIKLIDFGAGLQYGSKTGNRFGTYGYASPEQEAGKPMDIRSDVYAIGRLIMHLWFGQFPTYVTTKQLETMRCEQKGLYKIMQKCIAADKNARYASANQLGEELSKLKCNRREENRCKCRLACFRILYYTLLFSAIACISIGLEGWLWEGIAALKMYILWGTLLIPPALFLENAIKKMDRRNFIVYPENSILLGDMHLAELLIIAAVTFSSLCSYRYHGTANMWLELKDESNANILLKNGCRLQTTEDVYVQLPTEDNDIYQIQTEFGKWEKVTDNYKIESKSGPRDLIFRKVDEEQQNIVTHTLQIGIDTPK